MAHGEGSDVMLNRVMTKDNIALAVILEPLEQCYRNYNLPPPNQESINKTRLCVATCHIHWDPEFCDVKLIQSMMLCEQLRRLIDEASRTEVLLRPGATSGSTGSSNVQLLLCGDFNSLPQSGIVIVVRFFRQRHFTLLL